MYADFKCTMWERVLIPDDLEEEFLQKIKDGNIETAEDCFTNLSSDDLQCDPLSNTSCPMTVEDNEGNCVIEIYTNSNEFLYDNVNGFVNK